MTTTVRELAELVGGEIVGDGSVAIEAARPLGQAGPGDITFFEAGKNPRLLTECRASALVCRPNQPHAISPAICVDDPLDAFVRIFRYLHLLEDQEETRIDPRASIDPTAQCGPEILVGPFASIGAGAVVGNRCRIGAGAVIGAHCLIGDDVIIYPNAVIYDRCVIGNRVIIHANAVIGSDGFGYRQQNGRHVKVPQLGWVEVEDDVEIGACTTVDRGTFQATRIGAGTKIDNLVQVAHNCSIGRHNLLISQVGIAGSSTTGDYVVIAGQAGIVDHVHIGDGAVIGAQAGVINDVPAGQRLLGSPARPERDVKIMVLNLEKLPELRKEVRQIKQQIEMHHGGPGLARESA